MKSTKGKKQKKTWLDLSKEELEKIETKSACMYGRKTPDTIPTNLGT